MTGFGCYGAICPKTGGISEDLIDEDWDQEVSPAHSGKNEGGHAKNGPDRHLQFPFGLLCMFDGRRKGKSARDKAQCGEDTEKYEEEVVGHKKE